MLGMPGHVWGLSSRTTLHELRFTNVPRWRGIKGVDVLMYAAMLLEV